MQTPIYARRLRALADPDLAVGVALLLPDRHGHLERVDGLLAGGEGRGAVGRGDRDSHRGLADRDHAGAVPDGRAQAAVLGADGAPDAPDLLLGHPRVGL